MTRNFALKVCYMLCMESADLDGLMAKIGLDSPMCNRVKVLIYFWGLNIETQNFSFDEKVQFSLESTVLDGR